MGIPNRLHSGRGSQFTSEMMKEVYRLLSIRQSTTSPYHAMGNGIVKNFNKTIKNLLKKIVAKKPRDWHRYLGPLMFAVRETPQDSTGFTAFELIYGHEVRTPMNILKKLCTELLQYTISLIYSSVYGSRGKDRISVRCRYKRQVRRNM